MDIKLESNHLPSDDVLAPESKATPLTKGAIAKALIKEVAETLILGLLIVLVIQIFVKNFRVEGHSMEPNLHHGQYLAIDKISYNLPYNLRPPQRGDIIVFNSPTQAGKDYIKRIIGLPGDRVEIKRGIVYVNDAPFPNVFRAKVDKISMRPRIVSEGELFVLGDNRQNSSDSRSWGMLPTDRVIGKAWVSYWPVENWGLIPNNAPTISSTLDSLLRQSEAQP